MIFALDIGGTFTKFAHIERDRIVKKGKWETTDDFFRLIQHIGREICENVEAIGISSGGFWDENGRAIGYETMKSLGEHALTDALSSEYGCRVAIENDARCALLAEKTLGALRNTENAVLFVLGSSLGCAVLLNGAIYTGATKQAGSMFLMPEFFDGKTYRYDDTANSIRLTKHYDASLTRGDMLLLERQAAQQDEKAADLLDSYAGAVALKCWYAYLMYDPSCVVLGGGIANSDLIFEKIKKHLTRFFRMDQSGRTPKLLRTEFGEDSNLLGAALLTEK